MSTSSR